MNKHLSKDITDFWRSYKMNDCVNNISESWKAVGVSCLNKAWRAIYPTAIHATANNEADQNLDLLRLGSRISGEKITTADVDEILNESIEPTAEDIEEMFEESDHESDVEEEPEPRRVLSSDAIRRTRELLDEAVALMTANDPEEDRVEVFQAQIITALRPYKALLISRISVQPTMADFLNRSRYCTTVVCTVLYSVFISLTDKFFNFKIHVQCTVLYSPQVCLRD